MEVLQLYISGGSFRCATAASGVVAYLAHTDRWADPHPGRGIRRVASVSGGSLLNGALVAAPQEPDDDPRDAIGAFLTRLVDDKGSPFATWRRRSALLVFLLGLAVACSGALVATGVLETHLPSSLRFVVGLAFMPWCLWVFRKYFAANTRDLARSLVPGPAQSRGDVREREHIICGAGLTTGEPFLFYWPMNPERGRLLPVDPSWGQVVLGQDSLERSTKAIDITSAVTASTSLPGAGE